MRELYKHSTENIKRESKRAVPGDDVLSVKQWQYMRPLSKPIA